MFAIFICSVSSIRSYALMYVGETAHENMAIFLNLWKANIGFDKHRTRQYDFLSSYGISIS